MGLPPMRRRDDTTAPVLTGGGQNRSRTGTERSHEASAKSAVRCRSGHSAPAIAHPRRRQGTAIWSAARTLAESGVLPWRSPGVSLVTPSASSSPVIVSTAVSLPPPVPHALRKSPLFGADRASSRRPEVRLSRHHTRHSMEEYRHSPSTNCRPVPSRRTCGRQGQPIDAPEGRRLRARFSTSPTQSKGGDRHSPFTKCLLLPS